MTRVFVRLYQSRALRGCTALLSNEVDMTRPRSYNTAIRLYRQTVFRYMTVVACERWVFRPLGQVKLVLCRCW